MFKIHFYSDDPNSFDENGNIDIEVTLDGKTRFSATFFSIESIGKIIEKNKQTGENKNGLYFFCSDMIIVEKISKVVIEETVSDMVKKNILQFHFSKLDD